MVPPSACLSDIDIICNNSGKCSDNKVSRFTAISRSQDTQRPWSRKHKRHSANQHRPWVKHVHEAHMDKQLCISDVLTVALFNSLCLLYYTHIGILYAHTHTHTLYTQRSHRWGRAPTARDRWEAHSCWRRSGGDLRCDHRLHSTWYHSSSTATTTHTKEASTIWTWIFL